MRFIESQPPFSAPCFSKASSAYAEHVGANLHFGADMGEIRFLYPRTMAVRTLAAVVIFSRLPRPLFRVHTGSAS